jgi:hypothetical protein
MKSPLNKISRPPIHQSQILPKFVNNFFSKSLNNLQAFPAPPTRKLGSVADPDELAFLQENFLFMAPRDIRRAVERQARKAARKSRFPIPQSIPSSSAVAPEESIDNAVIDTTRAPEPSATISSARLNANRANAQLSTGPSLAGRAISCLNHTTHGLARHGNGTFRLLTTEDPVGFEALTQSLLDEHQATTPTELILIHGMAESLWLAQRAQRLQDTCLDPATGDIKDEKKFSLYLRYQTTHTRAFHKSLNDLLKLRAEQRKVERGFEAQKRKEEENLRKIERHATQIALKDAQTRHQIGANAVQQGNGRCHVRKFEQIFAEELANHCAKNDSQEAPAAAA